MTCNKAKRSCNEALKHAHRKMEHIHNSFPIYIHWKLVPVPVFIEMPRQKLTKKKKKRSEKRKKKKAMWMLMLKRNYNKAKDANEPSEKKRNCVASKICSEKIKFIVPHQQKYFRSYRKLFERIAVGVFRLDGCVRESGIPLVDDCNEQKKVHKHTHTHARRKGREKNLWKKTNEENMKKKSSRCNYYRQ